MENSEKKKKAQELRKNGLSFRQISKELNVGKETARKWLLNNNKNVENKNPFFLKQKDEEILDFLRNLAPISNGQIEKTKSFLSTKPNKIALVIGDIHFGSHSEPVLDIFLETICRLKPETIILNGDTLDMFSISRYPKDIRINSNLLDERKAYHKFLKEIHSIMSDYDFNIFETNSNHSGNGVEGRYWRYLSDRLGELACLPELQKNLSYESMFFPQESWSKIKLADYVEICNNFIVQHGDVVRKHGGYSARGMLEKWWGVSMIINHTHRFGATSQRVPSIGNQKERIIRVYENGCACDLSPCYATAANWQNSFSIVNYSDPTCNPAVEQVLVHKNSACISTLGETIIV